MNTMNTMDTDQNSSNARAARLAQLAAEGYPPIICPACGVARTLSAAEIAPCLRGRHPVAFDCAGPTGDYGLTADRASGAASGERHLVMAWPLPWPALASEAASEASEASEAASAKLTAGSLRWITRAEPLSAWQQIWHMFARSDRETICHPCFGLGKTGSGSACLECNGTGEITSTVATAAAAAEPPANPDEYNGWANFETWNVALWLGNDRNSEATAREIVAEAWNAAAEEIAADGAAIVTPLADAADALRDWLRTGKPADRVRQSLWRSSGPCP